MSLLWTYGAAIATVLLAFFSLYEDFFSSKSSKRRIGMSVGLIVAAVFIMVSVRIADKQHTQDESKITALNTHIDSLQGLVKDANQTVKDTSKQLSEARAADTTKFLSEFDSLSGRVADLQTQVATTDLKAEAANLQADLEATRKAMNPEKAKLDFSLDSSKPSLHTIALEQHNNVVHLKIEVSNDSDADALDGDVIITICDKCKYRSEPAGTNHLDGAPETQRNLVFERVLAHTGVALIEFDVEAPSFPFNLSVGVVCRTCVGIRSTKSFYGDSIATVYVTNPQPNPLLNLPPIPVHPYFNQRPTKPQ
jgi:hypothetical protein